MTDEENRAAEAARKASEEAAKAAEAAKQDSGKTYTAKEFHDNVAQAIADRDEAKKKLREREEAEAKRVQKELEEKGEYQKIAEALRAENATLKSKADEATAHQASLQKILEAEADGIEKVIANAIITNTALSFEERFESIRSLKKSKSGTGNSAGTPAGSSQKKVLTDEEVAKLSSVEKAKYIREKMQIKGV
jgi:lambda repressor-like predicted transcriptional regulator